MEFDKSRVYTALNADELKIGSRCFFANTILGLRKKVQNEIEVFAETLTCILDDSKVKRFEVFYRSYIYAYLIEPPVEIMSDYTYTEEEMRTKKYKCRDVCPTWNREDRDCEIYGETHPVPLQCPYFAHHIKSRNDK